MLVWLGPLQVLGIYLPVIGVHEMHGRVYFLLIADKNRAGSRGGVAGVATPQMIQCHTHTIYHFIQIF